jgi:signal transduction histidine kinase
VRLRIDPAVVKITADTADQRLALLVEPQHLGEVAAFLVDRPDYPLMVVGDTVLPMPGQPQLLGHFVSLPKTVEPFEVLLRLRSESTHIVKAEALLWDDLRDFDAQKLSALIAFLVFTALIAFVAALFWLNGRDPVLLFFIAHQVSAMLTASAQLGLIRLWAVPWLLSPAAVDWIAAAMIPLHALLLALFHIKLLRELGANYPERRWLWLLLIPGVLALLLMVTGFRQLALQITIGMMPLSMPLLMGVALRCRPEVGGEAVADSRWRRTILIGAYAGMMAMTIPQALQVLGLMSFASMNFGWFLVYSVVSTLLMGGLLCYRFIQTEKRRREMALSLRSARELANVQQARVVEQSELIAMLTHELKTPLSVISLVLSGNIQSPLVRKRALRATENMRQIIDRCAHVANLEDKINAEGVWLNSESLDIAGAIREVVASQVHGGRIDCIFSADLPACSTDRNLLQIIISNLLENALKYGPLESNVRIIAEPAKREGQSGVTISVFNAVGRAGRPDPDRLFEKYHRGASAMFLSGSGVGLYLSRRLAHRISGDLSLLECDEVCFQLWVPETPRLDVAASPLLAPRSLGGTGLG